MNEQDAMIATRRRRNLPAPALAMLGLILVVGAAAAQVAPDRLVRTRLRGPRLAKFAIQVDAPVADEVVAVSWRSDEPEMVDAPGVASLTWFYATDALGTDRKRAASTLFHETFDGDVRDRWVPVNPLREDWKVLPEGGRRGARYLRVRSDGEPLVSLDHFATHFVVSARVRPREGARAFGVCARAELANPGCYALIGAARLLNPNAPRCLDETSADSIAPGQWYWYELGVGSIGKKLVAVRGRIWDGAHEQLLVDLKCLDPCAQPLCPKGQRIGLMPGADYSEVLVDPWYARWLGDRGNFEWDTREVPDGQYYLIAVINDSVGGSARQRVSASPITIKH